MNAALLTLASTTAVWLAGAAEPQGKPKTPPPPGLVLVQGGSTRIGSTVDYVTAEGKKNELVFQNIVCETPQHEVRVDDFFLMVSEVTNEQYAAFVRATGARPPEHWAVKLIDEASAAWIKNLEEERIKAKAEGRPVPERVKFDRTRWWRDNWQGKEWEVPKGRETFPVVYVDYQDAKAYARWAGLRLMTEEEYQRAGRGNSKSLYPWGDEPDPTKAVVQELSIGGRAVKPSEPMRVGALGTATGGLYDLCGNVWEWTSSPFVAFPGYKDLQIEVGAGKQQRRIDGLTGWNADQRVVVGGCFQTSLLAGRLTTRRPTDRQQSTDSLGFRCAASTVPGRDIATWVMAEDMPTEMRPEDSQFDASKVVALDRWSSAPGSAVVVAKEGEAPKPMPDYALIQGYDYVLYVPAVDIDAVSGKGLAELSATKGTVPLGVLSTTKPMIEPALDTGTYLVAFHAAVAAPVEASGTKEDGKGKGKEKGKPDEKAKDGIALQDPPKQEGAPAASAKVEVRLPAGYDGRSDALLFYKPGGEPVTWIPAPSLEYARPSEPTITVADGKRDYTVEEGGLRKHLFEDATIATVRVNSWVKVSNKGFSYTLRLMFKPGTIGADWRMPREK